MGCCNSTAADVARQRQQREIAANGLREACRRGDPVMIKALMRDEFQASSENFVNTADESGNRPLHEKEVAKAKVRLRDLRFGPPAM